MRAKESVMSMDPSEWLTPQHRRLFKFLHPAKPASGLLLERFEGNDGLSQASRTS
jgi:type VI secretion system secreted protein VgrG